MKSLVPSLLLAFLVTGCMTTSTPPPAPIISSHCIPASDLMTPARGPLAVPRRDLSEKEIVRFWGRDRATLRKEADRHNDLSGFVRSNCR